MTSDYDRERIRLLEIELINQAKRIDAITAFLRNKFPWFDEETREKIK
jgi:hypothetical protein